MSSTLTGEAGWPDEAFYAANCINGNTGGFMCHSDLENAPWLAIDFGKEVDVRMVTIFNRKDCCGDRFRNVEVRVTDTLPTDGTTMFAGGELFNTFDGPAANGEEIQIKGEKDLRGRYVLVQQGNRDYLNLHEVTVVGHLTSTPPRLSNIYGDHMVFQRAPSRPLVWGWGTPGSTITVTVLDSQGSDVTIDAGQAYVGDDEKFEVVIGSYEAGTGFSVNIRQFHQMSGQFLEVTLTDVAFGEVWVCSGQSNMEWRVKDARDGAKDVLDAEFYDQLRLIKTVRQIATEPQEEALGFYNSWRKPMQEFLGRGESFSAICLYFGEQLWEDLQVPIGLIESTWGGTIVEAWSPPRALEYCGVTDTGVDSGSNHNEYLWNAMIHPFLKMTIRGAIWYQGEQNAGYPGDYPGHNRDLYSCTFPAMVAAWRQAWAKATDGDTDRKFPFGFVQLASFTNQRENLAWPQLRWHQTADVGVVPNDILQKVFMATAVDSDIDLHPKNKRLPASRLAWAASNLVYGMADRPLNGPKPVSVSFGNTARTNIVVTFSAPIEPVVIEEDRFMVCCLSSMDECDQTAYGTGWQGVTIQGMAGVSAVELAIGSACDGRGDYSGLAYLWLETPCSSESSCPLYAADSYRLPVAPWRQLVDLRVCPLFSAQGGEPINILKTGIDFLQKDSQAGCHAACRAHSACLHYHWYDLLAGDKAHRCYLLASQDGKLITEDFLQSGSKHCDLSPDPLDTYFSLFGQDNNPNGQNAGNGGRDSYILDYVEALTAAIQAEDLYFAGLHQEAANLVASVWEKFPVGAEIWAAITGAADNNGAQHGGPYPLLRMVDDMNRFRLDGDIPATPKYNATMTVVLARAETILPTAWDDFDLTTGVLKPGRGVRKLVGFNDYMNANNHQIIHDSLRSQIAYIEDAVAEGQIKITLKVIEAYDPVNCDFRLTDLGKIGKYTINCGYPFYNVMTNLPKEVLESTNWYFLAYPNLSKELTSYTDFIGLQSIGGYWGGTGGIWGKALWFGTENGWTGLAAERGRGGEIRSFRNFTEVETRTWWPELQQHELFHYLFRLYRDLKLEEEGHQWFDRSKWPEDFQGRYEKDYFHEALYKRLLLADIPPYEKIQNDRIG